MSREGNSRMLCEGFGLARYAVPSGRVLNRILLDEVPASHPWWEPPAVNSWILYAGGDGALYQLDFDPARGSDPEGHVPPAPRRVNWGCEPPGGGLRLKDPVWPADPRLGGRLIVSVQYQAHESDSRLTPSRLWWGLRLGDDGGTIVATGPLTDASEPEISEARLDERFPNVARGYDGGLLLAYLRRAADKNEWDLSLAPITIDGRTVRPGGRNESGRVLACEHLPMIPLFSADRRWVFGVLDDPLEPRVERYPARLVAQAN